ncbi:MAG: hypothetical protein PWQ41_1367 [Bacillota bacterium]|nr:hypothetical protein [Bacillota bacterium]MDK2856309.1 hypothetical protein [Bacillota bacterium]MDK2925593.1 hypothetical protein [Bacillota bacterium]
MDAYKDLIAMVVRREMGVLGPEKTLALLPEAGVTVDQKGEILSYTGPGREVLDKLLRLFGERYGLWAVLACKIAVLKEAARQNLALPDVLATK